MKTKSRPRVEIEEFEKVLLIHKIFNSTHLRINATIRRSQLRALINSGWHVTRKPPSQRGIKERAGSYRHPISDTEISDAVLTEDYEEKAEE